MAGLLGLLIVHAMAASAMWIYASRYGMTSPRNWAIASAILGLIPFGPLAWLTRDDWGIGNKLVGCLMMAALEILVLALPFA